MMKLIKAATGCALFVTTVALILVESYQYGSQPTCSMPDANGNKAMSLHEYNMQHAIRWTD